MADGFHTILGDLASAAGAFHDGAHEFAGALGDVKSLRVDSGDGGLDETIRATLEALDALHTKIVEALNQTGDKLTQVHDQYQRTDVSARELYDDVMHVEPIEQK
jgi:Family of unknown function (DUF6317)